jgi:hypothetical protein
MNGKNTEEYLNLDARGTIIKIPYDTAKKSPVLKAYIDNGNKEAYYLNYSAKVVNKLVDYLLDNNEFNENIKKICDELCIDLSNDFNKYKQETLCIRDFTINNDNLCIYKNTYLIDMVKYKHIFKNNDIDRYIYLFYLSERKEKSYTFRIKTTEYNLYSIRISSGNTSKDVSMSESNNFKIAYGIAFSIHSYYNGIHIIKTENLGLKYCSLFLDKSPQLLEKYNLNIYSCDDHFYTYEYLESYDDKTIDKDCIWNIGGINYYVTKYDHKK